MERGKHRYRAAAALAVVASMSAVALAPAQAAGPYDGNWSGAAAGTTTAGGNSGACNASITATVQNNLVKGTMTFPRNTAALTGTIAPDGSFKSTGGGITGKFAGNSFTGQIVIPGGYCNPYRMTLSRS